MSLSRRWRLAGLLTLAVLLLLAGALLAAPLLVDRDTLLRRIEAEASAIAGAPVQIDAVTQLRLLPAPRLVLGPVRVLTPMPPTSAQDVSLETEAGDAASAPVVLAERVQLDLSVVALLRGRVEPVLLEATGLDLYPRWPALASPPRWLAALPRPALSVQAARLTIDYPPHGRPVGWPLLPSASAALRGPLGLHGGGPLRVAATLPLHQNELGPASAPTGTLRLDAEIHPSAPPALRIAPLRLVGDDIAVGELRDLSLELLAGEAVRDADSRWRLADLALVSGAVQLTFDAEIPPAREDAQAAHGKFALAPFDPRAWLAAHTDRPLPGHPRTLRCLGAQGEFALAGDLLTAAPLALRLDDTQVRAAAALRVGPVPRVAAALHLDRLDLDAYLAPAAAVADSELVAGPTCADAGAAVADLPVSLPLITDADARFDVAADQLRFAGLSYRGLDIAADQRGLHSVADVKAAAFYGGELTARVEQAIDADMPRQVVRAKVAGADLAALLTDLQGTATVSGIADLTAELAASGHDLAALRSGLSGSIRAELRDGRFAALDQAAANFGPLLATIGLSVDADTLTFSRISLTAEGHDGVFKSDDIDGRARLFRLDGTGQLDAVAESLNLALAATLVQPPDGPDLQGLDGIRVPIAVRGHWAAPAVNAELGPAVGEAARRTARRHLEGDGNLFEQLEDATGVKGLEQGLRGLFGL